MTQPTRTLLFAAGDVGGARAILPVARLAHAQGHQVLALAHGVLHAEGDPDWTWLSHAEACAAPCDTVFYATSVTDPLAFQCALAAQSRGCPVIHVLDNWSLYGDRLKGLDTTGTPQTVVPDCYAVMDELANAGAIADNVPADRLHITGHPDLAKLDAERDRFSGPTNLGLDILFVSEPALSDSGAATHPDSRGYDETTVTQAFIATLGQLNMPDHVTLRVAPHPREDRQAVHNRWIDQMAHAGLSDIPLILVPKDGVRAALHRATHVVGMTSILLYEAWLLERPTLSLQPNLQWDQMRVIGQRQGVSLCTNASDIPATMSHWVTQRGPVGYGRESRLLHSGAAARLLDLSHQISIKPIKPHKDIDL